MNQDQLKEIGLKLYKRLDLVITGTLLLLLVLSGWMVYKEQSTNPPEAQEPELKVFASKMKLDGVEKSNEVVNPKYDEVRVSVLEANADINKNPAARRIIVNNMFVMKTAAEQEAAREESNRKFNQAETLFKEGNLDGARKLIDEVLLADPRNTNARQLKERLDAPAPTPTP